MRLVLRFEFYSVEELAQDRQAPCQGIGVGHRRPVAVPDCPACRGTPRLALRLLQACHRVCRADGRDVITRQHLRTACSLEHIDDLGLGPMEQHYLRALAEGATRLNVISSMLGLPTRTLGTVTEPFLIRAGLVCKDDDGRRQITAAGREQVSKTCPISVQLPSK